jgi:hypothetical protein
LVWTCKDMKINADATLHPPSLGLAGAPAQ